ncbi:MAG: hypothetical protein ABEJ99_04405 [Candidatus Nanohaloarchaea archaeon]
MKKLAAIAAFLMLVSTASALDISRGQLTQAKQTYNKRTDSIPSVARGLISDQRITVHLESGDNYSAVLDGLKMQKIEKGDLNDPTLEVWTSVPAVKKIASSDNPRDALKNALNQGNVDYEAHGWMNKIKFWFAEQLI